MKRITARTAKIIHITLLTCLFTTVCMLYAQTNRANRLENSKKKCEKHPYSTASRYNHAFEIYIGKKLVLKKI
jgi:hypothetical protein